MMSDKLKKAPEKKTSSFRNDSRQLCSVALHSHILFKEFLRTSLAPSSYMNARDLC